MQKQQQQQRNKKLNYEKFKPKFNTRKILRVRKKLFS
jgi:hypothetical protein